MQCKTPCPLYPRKRTLPQLQSKTQWWPAFARFCPKLTRQAGDGNLNSDAHFNGGGGKGRATTARPFFIFAAKARHRLRPHRLELLSCSENSCRLRVQVKGKK